ncbi:hypothetical protein ABD624_04530 [Avibacterium paragallinarum]
MNMKPNIPQNNDMANDGFLNGDVVVFTDPIKPGHLMTVYKVQGDGVLLNGNHNFALSHLVRPATVAEVLAKRRLTAVEMAMGEVS